MVRRFDDVMERFAGDYVISVPEGPTPTTIPEDAIIDLRLSFGREAPLVVEIGPGSGEQLVAYASAHPETNLLAVEAWHPGVARTIAHAVAADVHNIRILEGDAAQLLPIVFGLSQLGETARNAGNPRADEVWTFFPDPWRKARHHKRRLVSSEFAETVAGVLTPGGVWRLATDWDDYAWQMRDVVEGCALLANPYQGERPDPNDPDGDRGGFAPRWSERVTTRFEKRGTESDRSIHDIVGRKIVL